MIRILTNSILGIDDIPEIKSPTLPAVVACVVVVRGVSFARRI